MYPWEDINKRGNVPVFSDSSHELGDTSVQILCQSAKVNIAQPCSKSMTGLNKQFADKIFSNADREISPHTETGCLMLVQQLFRIYFMHLPK